MKINKKYFDFLIKNFIYLDEKYHQIIPSVKFFWVIFLCMALGTLFGLNKQMGETIQDNVMDIKILTAELKSANNRLLIMSQAINLNELAQISIDDDMLTIVPTVDYQKYSWIKEHNNYSNPLSDEDIWNIIMELHSCKNNQNLLLSIAQVESSFDKDAVSEAGCCGLMQINPIHKEDFNFELDDLFEVRSSIRIADELISYWQKDKKLSTKEILEKYLGCDSKNYYNKVISNLRLLNNIDNEKVI